MAKTAKTWRCLLTLFLTFGAWNCFLRPAGSKGSRKPRWRAAGREKFSVGQRLLSRLRASSVEAEVDIFGRALPSGGDEDDDHLEARKHFVVKVFCMYSGQDPSHPWTNKQQEDRMGSGCVILHQGQRCLLTNAHVVADASYVEVRKAGNAKKFFAERLKIAHECDLALLGQLPNLQAAPLHRYPATGAMLLAVLGIGGGACALHFLIQWLVCKRMSLAGKHVLITGGSQGLGLSLAKLCYTKGAKVTIVARTKKKLEQACEEVRKIQSQTPGAKIQNISMDVSSMRSAHFAELMTEAAQAEGFGRVDVVVCNAGTGVAKLLVGTPLEQIDELMDAQISTNLLGSLRCASAAAQVMASDGHGGRVCIVSSAAGLISLPGYAVYSATKFGHRGFLAGAYHELQQHGVDLSVYYPGSIETPGFEHEKQLMPTVTSRIESSCSDVSKAEDAAAVLLAGIEKGTKEITNELLPSLVVDHPTGFAPLDALVAAVTQCIRAGWSTYLRVMARQYISPVSRSA